MAEFRREYGHVKAACEKGIGTSNVYCFNVFCAVKRKKNVNVKSESSKVSGGEFAMKGIDMLIRESKSPLMQF